MSDLHQPVIARSEATKQSSWIATSASALAATPGLAGLAMTFPARVASGLIWVYQRTVSPALVAMDPTGGCRFAPTCSHYARGALAEHGFIAGTGLTLRRLAKCGPWHPGGEDPVPLADHQTAGLPDNQTPLDRPRVCVSVRRPSSPSHG